MKKPPKTRLREIADRLQAVFMASTREESIAATLVVAYHSVQDVGWLLQREAGLRARLQEALRRVAELERSSPAPAIDELRDLSNQVVLSATMQDAFSDGLELGDDEIEIVETIDAEEVVRSES